MSEFDTETKCVCNNNLRRMNMSKLSQREAVYQAVMNVLGESGISFEDGMNAKSVMTKEHRGQVNVILATGFTSGEIELKDTESNRTKLSDPSEMKEYVSGLQSNWLNKDTRLNGGVDHEIKNPGSRAGTGDSQLKALRSLMAISTDPVDKAELQGYIDTRISEIAKTKPKTTAVIDFSSLPAELQAKYSK